MLLFSIAMGYINFADSRISGQTKIEGLISRLRRPIWYWPLAALLTGFNATSLYISAHRLFWGDEILRPPSACATGAVWQTLSAAWNRSHRFMS
jgi:hypothetical protein